MRPLIAALALLVAACGSGAADTTTTTPATEETTVSTTTTEPASDDAQRAADGDTVQVHYRGTLDDGTEFDSSEGRDPLEFVVGSGQVIAGFDNAVRGLAVGESVTVRIPPEDAYGPRSDDAIIELPIDQAPEGIQPGQQVRFSNGATATVLEVTNETVKLDANHPLAGEALTFEIELVSIG